MTFYIASANTCIAKASADDMGSETDNDHQENETEVLLQGKLLWQCGSSSHDGRRLGNRREVGLVAKSYGRG